MRIGTVVINGIRYDVTKRKMSLKDNPEKNAVPWGICDFDQTLITLNDAASHERRFISFIHECFHVILYDSVSQQHIKNGKLEDLIEGIEAPLASFIRDNIKLIRKMGRF